MRQIREAAYAGLIGFMLYAGAVACSEVWHHFVFPMFHSAKPLEKPIWFTPKGTPS